MKKKENRDLKGRVREGKWCHLNSQGYPLPFKSKAGRSQQTKDNPVLSDLNKWATKLGPNCVFEIFNILNRHTNTKCKIKSESFFHEHFSFVSLRFLLLSGQGT